MSGMPTYPYLYADDLVAVLKKKHAAGTYKSMVIHKSLYLIPLLPITIQ